MSFSTKLITIATSGSWGPGDDFHISLVLKDATYTLRGKRVRVDNLQHTPQILRKTVMVTTEWATALLDELRNTNIPVYPPEMTGCDGTFYSMSLGNVYGGATYTWWSCPPDGWEILPKITDKIIDEFSNHLYE